MWSTLQIKWKNNIYLLTRVQGIECGVSSLLNFTVCFSKQYKELHIPERSLAEVDDREEK